MITNKMSAKSVSVANILRTEYSGEARRRAFMNLLFMSMLAFIVLKTFNMYFEEQVIFQYYNVVDTIFKQEDFSDQSYPIGPWKLVFALKIPFLKYNFQNEHTPIILRELILQTSCMNPNQCASCTKTTPPVNPQGGCVECSNIFCQMHPLLFAGNIVSKTAVPAPGMWNKSDNPYRFLIPDTAPIVPGAPWPGNNGKPNVITQTELCNILFAGGFMRLAESTNWTLEDFWNNVFAFQQKNAPCTKNWIGFLSSVGSAGAGASMGAVFLLAQASEAAWAGPVGVLLVLATMAFNAVGAYQRNLSCSS